MTDRQVYDWDRIEIEYRANKLSNREIAKNYGPSEGMIRKKAKKEGWQRDLAKKVKDRTNEKLVRKAASKVDAKDEEVIEEIADRNATVVETHRSDIHNARNLSSVLMTELYDNSKNHVLLEEIIDQSAEDEEWQAQRRQAVNRAVSLPQRSAVLRDLVSSMKTLQGLERTAYGLDGKESDELSYEERLRNLLGDDD